jgi:hypothetical protein
MSIGAFDAPEGPRVIIDGQSLNLTPNDAALDTSGRKVVPGNFPALLMRGLDIPVVCTAVGGEGWFERIPNLAAQVYPQFRKKAGCPDIVIANGGQGDIIDVPGATGASAYASFTTYVNNLRANGATKVIATTMPAMGPDIIPGRPTAGEYTAIANLRTLMLANAAGCDAVVDLQVAPLNDATNGTYFFVDRLHIVVPGAEAMANLVRPALDSVLATL